MEGSKIDFALVTAERLRKEAQPALLNEHRHLHGLAELGEVDCAELERIHKLVVDEMTRRGLEHNSPLVCKAKAGLKLNEPHAYLVWKGKKKSIALPADDGKGLDGHLVGVPLVLCQNGAAGAEAYGEAILGNPAAMTPAQFDLPEYADCHCVRPEERREWWDGVKQFYVYPIKSFARYDKPRPVMLQTGCKCYLPDVRFKQYQPPTDKERAILAQSEKLPKQIILAPRAVSLTGSMLYGQHEPRDVDVVVVGAEWREDEGQFVVPLTPTFKEKLERVLRAVYQTGNAVQYISEGEGPTFDHLPLYALALVRLPRLEVEHVSEMEPEMAEVGYDKDGVKYRPDQPRDEAGRFGSGAVGASVPLGVGGDNAADYSRELAKLGYGPPIELMPVVSNFERTIGNISDDRWDASNQAEEEIHANGVKSVNEAFEKEGVTPDSYDAESLMSSWEDSAVDEGGPQDMMQLEAARRLGGREGITTTEGMKLATEKMTDSDRAATKVAYDAIQQDTQSFFKSKGLSPDDEITVFRGVTGDYAKDLAGNYRLGESTPIKSANPLSSWSLDPEVSRRFAGNDGIMLEARVKVGDVFAHYASGFGGARESEVLVTPAGTQSARFVYMGQGAKARTKKPPLILDFDKADANWIKNVKRGNKALSSSAITRELRGATSTIRRQALQSYTDDAVVPGRPFVPLKPMRPAKEGQRQVFSRFADYVESLESWPEYVSAKRDGMRVTFHRRDGKVTAYSDDGKDTTDTLPELVKRLEEVKGGDFVLDSEVELWRDEGGGQHYPREAASGAIHSGEGTANLIANVFDVLYWDGKDLHRQPFAERLKVLNSLPADTKSDDALKPSKGLLNIIPHYPVKDRAELEKLCMKTAYKPGVEGVVVKRADGDYPLDGDPGEPPVWVKFHKSAAFNVVVLEAIETKVPGVFNYVYGIPAGDAKPAEPFELDGKTYMIIGKTFSSSEQHKVGDEISVESETVNFTQNEDGTVEVSFWVPTIIKGDGEKYSPNQPRDDFGRFGAGGALPPIASSPTAFLVKLELEEAKLPDSHIDGIKGIEFVEGQYVGNDAYGTFDPASGVITLASNAPKGGNIGVYGGGTILHEVGHNVHLAKLNDEAASEWAKISDNGNTARISAYARKNRGEHFAECYRAYTKGGEHRKKLKNLEPNSYKFMSSLMGERGSRRFLPEGQKADISTQWNRYSLETAR